MKSLHIQTPLIHSETLSQIHGKSVYLKLENTQPTGSFKLRGLGHYCMVKAQQGTSHFVGSSGGNAGVTLAYIGRCLNIPTTIYIPRSSPEIFKDAILQYGAKLEIAGDDWDEAHHHALRVCDKLEATYVPPFDHPLIWDGHATIIEEVAAAGVRPGAVAVAVGGGGLLCGVLQGMDDANWHDIPVFAVETLGACSFAICAQSGKYLTLSKIDTVATSLGAKQVTERLMDWLNIDNNITSVPVKDKQAVNACYRFLNDHRYLVEPACGATLSLVYEDRVNYDGDSLLIIVCGGLGINYVLLTKYLEDFNCLAPA